MEREDIIKLLDSLSKAETHCSSADHLVSVTMPVVGDAKLLMNGFQSIHKAMTLGISIILKIEELYRRIRISSNPGENLKIFIDHCAARYELQGQDLIVIQEIMFLAKKHSESAFEFSKNGKRVMLDDESGSFEIDAEKFKKYLQVTRKILERARNKLESILERYK